MGVVVQSVREDLLAADLMPSVRDVDVVIVGGGIAGSTLAASLARAGRGVAVVERERRFQDRVRGESIQGPGGSRSKTSPAGGGRTRGPRLEAIPPLLRAEGSTAGSAGRGWVERWRARCSVRWRSHSFRRGPQSGSHGDISSAPLRCRASSVPQHGAKPRCVAISQALPARAPKLKCQVHIPSGASRFD